MGLMDVRARIKPESIGHEPATTLLAEAGTTVPEIATTERNLLTAMTILETYLPRIGLPPPQTHATNSESHRRMRRLQRADAIRSG